MSKEQPMPLDKEELEILKFFESGGFSSIRNMKKKKGELENAARNILQKNRRINIRCALPHPSATSRRN